MSGERGIYWVKGGSAVWRPAALGEDMLKAGSESMGNRRMVRRMVRRLLVGAAAVSGWLVPAALPAQVAVRELGEPSAAFGEPFSLIAGVRELSDGRLLVSDALDESLYELTPDLSAARKIGRNGQGPEEYRQPDALFALAGDSTLMTDLGNGRLAVVAPDGSLSRSIPVTQENDGELLILLPAGVDRQGRFYFEPRGDGTIRDSAAVVRWHPAAGSADTVARIKLRDMAESASGEAGRVEVRAMPVPLSPEDGWAAAPDGRVAVVRVADYRVEWVQPDGRLVRGPPTPWEPVRVRTADKEAWVRDLASAGLMMMITNNNGQLRASMRRGGAPGRGGPDIDRFEWPETKPPFAASAVEVAPDGRLWVGRHVDAADRPEYDVFDGSGRRVGIVRLPAGRSLVGFGPVSVYVSRRDELDFQWLERYDLPSH